MNDRGEEIHPSLKPLAITSTVKPTALLAHKQMRTYTLDTLLTDNDSITWKAYNGHANTKGDNQISCWILLKQWMLTAIP